MINSCTFIGRVGQKPEVRFTGTGTAVASFSIACSEKFKGKDGQQKEETEWVNIVAWQKLGEICGEYLDNGSLVYICGKMKTRKWQDQSGNDKYTTEIVARDMKMLSPRGEGGGKGGNSSPEPNGGDFYGGSTGSDVPF